MSKNFFFINWNVNVGTITVPFEPIFFNKDDKINFTLNFESLLKHSLSNLWAFECKRIVSPEFIFEEFQ